MSGCWLLLRVQVGPGKDRGDIGRPMLGLVASIRVDGLRSKTSEADAARGPCLVACAHAADTQRLNTDAQTNIHADASMYISDT